MLLFILSQILGLAGVGKRTTGVKVGQQHLFIGTQHLVCLGHKMNATHNNNVSRCFCGLLGKSKAVTDEVCNILYVAGCIIVRKDYCILLLAHTSYLTFDINACRYRFIDKSVVFPGLFHITLRI